MKINPTICKKCLDSWASETAGIQNCTLSEVAMYAWSYCNVGHNLMIYKSESQDVPDDCFYFLEHFFLK